MSARDAKLSVLSQLDRACDEATRAGRELVEFKRYLGLLGLHGGSINRALDAISLTVKRMHAARCTLRNVASDDVRSGECA